MTALRTQVTQPGEPIGSNGIPAFPAFLRSLAFNKTEGLESIQWNNASQAQPTTMNLSHPMHTKISLPTRKWKSRGKIRLSKMVLVVVGVVVLT